MMEDKDKKENTETLDNEERKKEIEKKFLKIEQDLKNDDISKAQLYEWFKEEIERKDKDIERLKKENHVLFMTALKANQNKLDAITSSSTSTKNASPNQDNK